MFDILWYFGVTVCTVYGLKSWCIILSLFLKVVCSSTDSSYHNRVVGLHITGPNAGEITQGFAVAIK